MFDLGKALKNILLLELITLQFLNFVELIRPSPFNKLCLKFES